MNTQLLELIVAGQAPELVPLTVDQFHIMREAGILHDGDPVELIHGLLVWKDRRDSVGGREMMHGPQRASTVRQLFNLLVRRLNEHICFAQCQLPISVPPRHEPEPDVSIIRGPLDDYEERLPSNTDTLAIMEVADNSLNFDRTTKQRLSATAGIPVYWIVNLATRQIEVYSNPSPAEERYERQQNFAAGQTILLELDGHQTIEVPVGEILP